MRLATCKIEDKITAAFVLETCVVDLRAAAHSQGLNLPPKNLHDDLLGLLWAGDGIWKQLHDLHSCLSAGGLQDVPPQAVAPLDRVAWLPPLRRPGKLVCAGLNYTPPPGDDAFEPPPYPILFHKVASALTGHNCPVFIPQASRGIEYEGELAVVIGKKAKNTSPEDALSVVAGYTIANDIGAPDLQARSSQWTSGKISDTFCPFGPVLTTPDEIPTPQNLNIKTVLNGEVVQDGNTAAMIFGIAALVSYISSLATLEPGDIILSGSPKQIGDRLAPKILMTPGDVVQIEIEGLGELTNPIQAEVR